MKIENKIAKILAEKYAVNVDFCEKILLDDYIDGVPNNYHITSKYKACKSDKNALYSYYFNTNFKEFDTEKMLFEIKNIEINIYKCDSKDDDGEFDGDFTYDKTITCSLKEAYDFCVENELNLEF